MYRKALPRSDLNRFQRLRITSAYVLEAAPFDGVFFSKIVAGDRRITIAAILPTEAAVNQFRAVWQSLGMGEYLASGYLLPAKFGEHGQVFIPEFMLFHNRRIVG
jgi:hypothetical protein